MRALASDVIRESTISEPLICPRLLADTQGYRKKNILQGQRPSKNLGHVGHASGGLSNPENRYNLESENPLCMPLLVPVCGLLTIPLTSLLPLSSLAASWFASPAVSTYFLLRLGTEKCHFFGRKICEAMVCLDSMQSAWKLGKKPDPMDWISRTVPSSLSPSYLQGHGEGI